MREKEADEPVTEERQREGVATGHVMVKGWRNKAQIGPFLVDNISVNGHYVCLGVDTVMMALKMEEPAMIWKGH